MTEKNTVAHTITGRRPILSASMLNTSEPSSTPKFAATNTGPERGTCDAPIGEHGRRHVAHRLDVEAVHDQAGHAEHEDADVQRADAASSPGAR